MHRVRVLALLLPCLVLSGSIDVSADAEPATPGVLPAGTRTTRLDNGLTVITLPWDSPGIIAYLTLVRVGSRDEIEPGHSGYAHLFEHMMFRGTERVSEEEYERTLQRFGADNNAYTTDDYTLYHVTAPSSALETIVDIEADRFQHLKYDETQYRTETGAVLGEYNKSASNPSLIMEEKLNGLAFSRHTYRHTTLGYLRDVQAMPDEFAYSQRFLARFYTPDNCTVIIAGDVDHDRVVSLAREHYGAWRGRRDQPRIAVEPEPRAGAQTHVEWEGQSPPRMYIGYRTPGFASSPARRSARPDRGASIRTTAALQVIQGLVFSESSPVYQELVVNQQTVLALSSYAGWFNLDPKFVVADVTLKPGVAFDAVRDRIQQELASIAANQATVARVNAVKSHIRYGLTMELATPTDVAEKIAHFMAVGTELSSLDEYLQALEALTPEDVADAARTYLIESRRFVVTLAPRTASTEGSAP